MTIHKEIIKGENPNEEILVVDTHTATEAIEEAQNSGFIPYITCGIDSQKFYIDKDNKPVFRSYYVRKLSPILATNKD